MPLKIVRSTESHEFESKIHALELEGFHIECPIAGIHIQDDGTAEVTFIAMMVKLHEDMDN